MKNINAGNVIVVAAVIVVALIILGFVSTLLSNIIPLTLVAVVAFLLGRASNNVNLLQAAGNIAKRAATERVKATVQAATTPKPAEAKPEPQAAEVKPERQAEAEANLSDFEIKTEDEILAEARLREQEIAKRSTAYDPTAALEERKRRLLNQQGNTPE